MVNLGTVKVHICDVRSATWILRIRNVISRHITSYHHNLAPIIVRFVHVYVTHLSHLPSWRRQTLRIHYMGVTYCVTCAWHCVIGTHSWCCALTARDTWRHAYPSRALISSLSPAIRMHVIKSAEPLASWSSAYFIFSGARAHVIEQHTCANVYLNVITTSRGLYVLSLAAISELFYRIACKLSDLCSI